MKNLLSGLLVMSVLLPVSLFAQTNNADIDPDGPVSTCVSLNNNLRYQSRDVNTNGEVSTLQDFLQAKGYLNSEPTGYFGLMTLAAVKSFQVSNGIEGTGFVGPLTRAKINGNSCGGTNPTPPSTPTECPNGTLLKTRTGEVCKPNPTRNLPAGCTSTSGFSPVTGQPCDGGGTTYPPGCTSASGFSSITGEYCDGSHPPSLPKPTVTIDKNTYTSTTGNLYLQWEATNITSCEYLKNGIFQSTLYTSEENTPNPGGSFTAFNGESYSVRCTGAGGTTTSNTVKATSTTSTCSTSGYDTRTGFRCGCTSTYGWSTTTGLACGGGTAVKPSVDLQANDSAKDSITAAYNSVVRLGWDLGGTLADDAPGSKTCNIYAMPSTSIWSGGVAPMSGYKEINVTETRTYAISCFDMSNIQTTDDVEVRVEKNINTNTCSDPNGFEQTTGLPCGCTSNSGWSTTTGLSCESNSRNPSNNYPPGCSSYYGWSTITGESCNE